MSWKFLKEYNQAKDIFISPKKKWYIGKLALGSPYFYPRGFVDTIINFRKLELTSEERLIKLGLKEEVVRGEGYDGKDKFINLPVVRRAKYWFFKLLGNYYWLQIGWPIMIGTVGLGWKDKFGTPRHEWDPQFYIYFFKWQLVVWWSSLDSSERYWEQMLWYLYYQKEYNKESRQVDINKARENWPWATWTDLTNGKKSTWRDDYLK